jgi:glycosyltransferase involved in cell wall biosynthesis
MIQRRSPIASILIPAHNEAAVIGSLLHVLVDEAAPDEFEVVVACNGCTDSTAQIASAYAGVKVVELSQPSKIAALNAGDDAATAFPRIYLDADIVISLESLRAVVAALQCSVPAAAPLPVLDTTHCSLASRAYFEIFSRLGYVKYHLIGAGVYGLSESGRLRFGRFPDVIGDDAYVYALFRDDERYNPPGATFTIRAPRTLRALYRRQVRMALGNLQLKARGHSVSSPPPTCLGVARSNPKLIPSAILYAVVQGFALLRARSLLRNNSVRAWCRDESSRGLSPGGGVSP